MALGMFEINKPASIQLVVFFLTLLPCELSPNVTYQTT